jgi:hypothetical protein
MYVIHNISFVSAINHDAGEFSALPGRAQLLIIMNNQEHSLKKRTGKYAEGKKMERHLEYMKRASW